MFGGNYHVARLQAEQPSGILRSDKGAENPGVPPVRTPGTSSL
jgi:hypothetical protein